MIFDMNMPGEHKPSGVDLALAGTTGVAALALGVVATVAKEPIGEAVTWFAGHALSPAAIGYGAVRLIDAIAGVVEQQNRTFGQVVRWGGRGALMLAGVGVTIANPVVGGALLAGTAAGIVHSEIEAYRSRNQAPMPIA